jgi:hypothetical protein
MKVIYWIVRFEMAIKEIITLYYMKGLNTQERTPLLQKASHRKELHDLKTSTKEKKFYV